MAIIAYPDGAIREIRPGNGRYFTLAEKCRLVPGHDEVIFFDDYLGMLLSSARYGIENTFASRVIEIYIPEVQRRLFGPVLIFGMREFSNDTLHDEYAELALRRLDIALKPLPLENHLEEQAWMTF